MLNKLSLAKRIITPYDSDKSVIIVINSQQTVCFIIIRAQVGRHILKNDKKEILETTDMIVK